MIIGLTGYKQAGKSVASKHLQERYGYKPHNFKDSLIKELKENFPDLLKTIARIEDVYTGEIGNLSYDIDRLFEEKPPLIRALMKNYGTEVRRREDPYYWISKWTMWLPTSSNIVVDDARFLIEAEEIKNWKGIIIRIIKTGQVNNDTHQTESEIDSITPDYTIEAEMGDKEAIYKQIDDILKHI